MISINQNKNGNVIASLLKASVAISMCVFFAACGEDSTNNSNNSEQAACSVSKNDDGDSYTLKCLDGTEVVIHDGKDGSDGKDGEKGADGSDGKDGEKGSDGKNGQNGSDGKNGTDGKNGEDGNDGLSGISGEGCSVKANDDGSFALSCPDGTSIVFNADGKVSQITKDSVDITPKLSSSSGKVPEPAEGSSSSAKTDGKSSSSKKTGVQPQGFVQFNADVYGSTVGNSIYLYDEDNASQTAKVLVRSIEAADTITVTLDRHDLYFYAPFQMSIYGGNGSVLRVAKTDFIVVEYKDPSTGVTEIDGATVALPSSNTVSLSFGRKTYSDTLDKAVITLVDSSLTADVAVTVKVTTPVDTTDIPLYPVEGGDGSERIGFVGFVLRSPLEGEVEVANGSVNATYGGRMATTEWKNEDEYYGLVCSKDGKVVTGLVNRYLSYVCDMEEFRLANENEFVIGKGCTSYNDGDIFYGMTCSSGKWKGTLQIVQGTMTDSRDKKKYKTVTIGSQTWMAENLNYNEKTSYTWDESLNACPSGWHLPDSTEWLILYYGVGKKMDALKSTGYEQWPNATNETGFSILPQYCGCLLEQTYSCIYINSTSKSYLFGGNVCPGSSNPVRCLKDSV
ncbi:FISUMP domain-containing protein [Fibrobacter sp.]|uniref:FISUMP domain-containing protein n=1 Tax=Fibrobacter sp. TaxID=35828 RepID=UPI00386D9F7C